MSVPSAPFSAHHETGPPHDCPGTGTARSAHRTTPNYPRSSRRSPPLGCDPADRAPRHLAPDAVRPARRRSHGQGRPAHGRFDPHAIRLLSYGVGRWDLLIVPPGTDAATAARLMAAAADPALHRTASGLLKDGDTNPSAADT
ncbi:DUF5994 family protein [Streptomyces massasporeus]|uniref:DUF5994 family protein n=1 Tax=Streptomyces massasporeus TaxID=67324 RepID=UPI0033FE1933